MIELPPDVQELLRDYIESFEQLELLLLLRDEPGPCWTQDALSARLGVPGSLMFEALTGLQSGGFLGMDTESGQKKYRYRIQSDKREATIGRLNRFYKEQPMLVMKLMSANAIERVRTAALRTFSDAFILRKDKNDG